MTIKEIDIINKFFNDIETVNKNFSVSNTQIVIRVNGNDYKLKDIVSIIYKDTLAPKIVLIAE